MQIVQLFQYPLKSCRADEVSQLEIVRTGVQNDRIVAAMDATGTVLTARTHPLLLQIDAHIVKKQLTLGFGGMESLTVSLLGGGDERPFRMFDHNLTGRTLGDDAAIWISEALRTDAQLVALKDSKRPMMPRHNAKEGDTVLLTDASPIHLISTASLQDLNERLDRQFPIHQFRPNLVVEGCDPYAEDKWKEVQIGDCVFEVHMACPRCVLSTIDPATGIADPQSEPLRSWAEYRKDDKGKVNFGVYMIPRKLGTIKKGMRLEL